MRQTGRGPRWHCSWPYTLSPRWRCPWRSTPSPSSWAWWATSSSSWLWAARTRSLEACSYNINWKVRPIRGPTSTSSGGIRPRLCFLSGKIKTFYAAFGFLCNLLYSVVSMIIYNKIWEKSRSIERKKNQYSQRECQKYIKLWFSKERTVFPPFPSKITIVFFLYSGCFLRECHWL